MKTALKIENLQPFGLLLKPQTSNTQVDMSLETVEVSELRTLFQQHQLLVFRGFKPMTTAEEFADYCELWGEISLWPFGKVLELKEQSNPQDHIFDHSYVPLHWDGMYRPQVPEIQVFNCVNSPGENHGGETTFSNTSLVLKNALENEKRLWSKVTGIYERQMEFYHSKTAAPVITLHPSLGYPVIRYCEQPAHHDATFLNHANYEFTGVSGDECTAFETSLNKALYASQNFYAHKWEMGDVVVSDNYTLLHGRSSFTSGAPRHLQRVHVLGNPALENPHLVYHT